eukprot:m.44201 g.44201  ORF g.44201 m.44201 type:complete len:382 (+) comp12995_c0_seq2:34-1179(+)
MLQGLSLQRMLVYGFGLRLLLIVWSLIQDKYFSVKYTDIDYDVFTDAARHVCKGLSPYERATYRYTPLLAWLLTPDCSGFPFGKLLFVGADMLSAFWLHSLALQHQTGGHAASTRARYLMAFWLFNPVVVVVSTRGSAESLVVLSILWLLKATLKQNPLEMGISWGLATHFKLFPVIFSLPAFLYLGSRRATVNERQLHFAIVGAVVFAGLGAAMYALYGNAFVEHTYSYHFGRRDFRHNFSAYFYAVYLDAPSFDSILHGFAAFLPLAVVQTWSAVRLHTTPTLCFAVQTVAFVALNKVYTSQYFLWYLPLVGLAATLRPEVSPKHCGIALAVWMLAQGFWLGVAYLLEFQGLDVFWLLSFASCSMTVAHVVCLWVLFAS